MNPNSLTAGNNPSASAANIDERRQKKRQRKQEKTRKVPSKVIYKPSQGNCAAEDISDPQYSNHLSHSASMPVQVRDATGVTQGLLPQTSSEHLRP